MNSLYKFGIYPADIDDLLIPVAAVNAYNRIRILYNIHPDRLIEIPAGDMHLKITLSFPALKAVKSMIITGNPVRDLARTGFDSPAVGGNHRDACLPLSVLYLVVCSFLFFCL